ncbi:hypothetical protein ACI2KR_06980 [Pseudomonas luteola]
MKIALPIIAISLNEDTSYVFETSFDRKLISIQRKSLSDSEIERSILRKAPEITSITVEDEHFNRVQVRIEPRRLSESGHLMSVLRDSIISEKAIASGEQCLISTISVENKDVKFKLAKMSLDDDAEIL